MVKDGLEEASDNGVDAVCEGSVPVVPILIIKVRW